jgi:hypothetical protein
LVPFTGETENPEPVQADAVMGLIVGVGLTVTVTVKVGPTQLPVVGVTV